MTKTILSIFIAFTFLACRQHNAIETSKFDRLSAFYKDTIFTEMFLFPDTSSNDSLYVFRGNQIDSVTFNILAESVTQGLPWTEGFYGIYSFKINNKYIGLLTRTPGEYSSSKISLWIYNTIKDSIVNNLQLANIYGDAGDFETINSYLYFNNQKTLKALTYRHYIYDHSVEEESDTIIEENRNYYLTKIGDNSIDTLSTDSSKLHRQFQNQLIRMIGY
ncbi:MAG TPA: hypothetical protein PLH61_08825 [Bacteroidia bacterium]|jgi:hypothetical protein|nr:hypothetical protein [Bacteroidia bacterium]HQK98111.1 hypothetical protein [Bacteroidia bacterium]